MNYFNINNINYGNLYKIDVSIQPNEKGLYEGNIYRDDSRFHDHITLVHMYRAYNFSREDLYKELKALTKLWGNKE